MNEQEVEALGHELFRWNTPTDPYFVINGRGDDNGEEDPYAPIARAILDSAWLAAHDSQVRGDPAV